MSNSTPLKLCIQIFHETKIRGLNGSISTLFDERMNLNIKLKIVPCRGYLISENVERCCTTVSSDFSFLSSVHLDIHVVHHRDDESAKKEKKEERSFRLGGNRKLPCYFSSNTVEGGRRVKRTRNRDAN